MILSANDSPYLVDLELDVFSFHLKKFGIVIKFLRIEPAKNCLISTKVSNHIT